MLTDSLKSSGGFQEHGYTGREARRMVSDLPPKARKNTYRDRGGGEGRLPELGRPAAIQLRDSELKQEWPVSLFGSESLSCCWR